MNYITNIIIDRVVRGKRELKRIRCEGSSSIEYDLKFIPSVAGGLNNIKNSKPSKSDIEDIEKLYFYRIHNLDKSFFDGNLIIMSDNDQMIKRDLAFIIFDILELESNGLGLNLNEEYFKKMFIDDYDQDDWKLHFAFYEQWKVISMNSKIREAVSSELENKECVTKNFKI